MLEHGISNNQFHYIIIGDLIEMYVVHEISWLSGVSHQFGLPYLPEYKSHPSISCTLYFCGENLISIFNGVNYWGV